MQQNDDEVVYSSLLTKEDYDRIENLVVDLYIELDIKSFPIDPIAIAKQKGYTLIPYSKLNKEEAIGLRRKVISGLNMGQKDGTQYIFYDDSEVIPLIKKAIKCMLIKMGQPTSLTKKLMS